MTRPANNFDLLRLIFASLVMLYHLVVLSHSEVGFFLFHLPTQAVDGFFVISGFLVAASADRTDGVLRFYVKRFFRLYPLYFSVVVAQAAAMTALLGLAHTGLLHELVLYLGANLTFANFLKPAMGDVLAGLPVPIINPSLWTLKIEVAFYLILPALVVLVRMSGRWALLAVLIASFAYRMILGPRDAELARQLPGALEFFVIGVAGHYLSAERYCRGPLAVVTCIASAVLCFGLWDRLPDPINALVLAVFVLTFAYALPAVRLRRDLSYGVYLLHAPLAQLILLATFGKELSFWVLLPVVAVASLISAYAAARLIEEPGIALGRQAILRPQLRPRMPLLRSNRAVYLDQD